MLAPTEGTVRVCGASTSGARPEELAKIRRQHIGFVFQSYHLFATLTVAENVRLALDVRGEHRLEAMVKSEEVRTARMGRNPATGEAITIKASKKVAFRAARI
jgi:putative ABC transport system ATP-binding protein